jgi:hypothetical protein
LIVSLFEFRLDKSDEDCALITDLAHDFAQKVTTNGSQLSRQDMLYVVLDTVQQLQEAKRDYYSHPMPRDEAAKIFSRHINLASPDIQQRFKNYSADQKKERKEAKKENVASSKRGHNDDHDGTGRKLAKISLEGPKLTAIAGAVEGADLIFD